MRQCVEKANCLFSGFVSIVGGYGQEDKKNAIILIVNQIHDGVWVFYKGKEKT